MKKNNLLKIWNTFRILSPNFCGKLFLLLLSKPHLAIGTVIATIEVSLESEKRFDADSHYGDGIANGFKHAAWNVLISYYAQSFYRSPEKAIQWAKKVTDLHEVCFPNDIEDTNMDLHNNEIGRNVYINLFKIKNKKPNKKLLLDSIAKQDLKTLS